MNIRSIYRLCATLLALALLASAAGLAEGVDGLEIVIDSGVPALPDAIGGIEADGIIEFDGPDMDEALDGLSLALPDTLPAPQASPADGAEANGASIPDEIELGVGEKYALTSEEASEGSLTYRSNRPKVASVDERGVIVGLARGKASIRCYRDKTLLGSCLVRVLNAPSEVSFDFSSIAIGVKESVRLEAKVNRGARSSFNWSVGNEKIVQVTQDGLITGRTPGRTTVTARAFNGKKARLTVKVAPAPGKLALSEKSLILERGKSFRLQVLLPKQTASHQITWSSSDEGVAAVDGLGTVTAVSKGEATVTARAFNGSAATCRVSVCYGPDDEDPDVTYRALLIGQTDFSTPMENTRADVMRLTKMLRTVRGLRGGSWQTTKAFNLDRSGVLRAIREAYAGAKDDDVSLFFISTHGVSDSRAPDKEAGALAMIPEGSDLLRMEALASALKKVPGKIIILINACGSGAGVHTKEKRNAPSANGQAAERFNQYVVDTFMQADPGIAVKGGSDAGKTRANTGELRVENKFYVLTASAYQENSWGIGGLENYSLFCKWLADGIGFYGRMKADADKNSRITLNEMYKYIVRVGNRYPIVDSEGKTHHQHVQVYPSKSDFVMFKR